MSGMTIGVYSSPLSTNFLLKISFSMVYAFLKETKTEKNVKSSDRSAPSGYRLAAHKYMVSGFICNE